MTYKRQRESLTARSLVATHPAPVLILPKDLSSWGMGILLKMKRRCGRIAPGLANFRRDVGFKEWRKHAVQLVTCIDFTLPRHQALQSFPEFVHYTTILKIINITRKLEINKCVYWKRLQTLGNDKINVCLSITGVPGTRIISKSHISLCITLKIIILAYLSFVLHLFLSMTASSIFQCFDFARSEVSSFL